jgi:DNA mismatch endonuclease, patch repair protein
MEFRGVNPSRSRLMSAVKSFGNRSTEQALRMALVRARISGWQLHERTLPGIPDFYFPRAKLAVFVDGCFWHGCTRCRTIPRTRRSFWLKKISGNRARHRRIARHLRRSDVRVLRVWEHSLKRKCVAGVVAKIYRETSTAGELCAKRS